MEREAEEWAREKTSPSGFEGEAETALDGEAEDALKEKAEEVLGDDAEEWTKVRRKKRSPSDSDYCQLVFHRTCDQVSFKI